MDQPDSRLLPADPKRPTTGPIIVDEARAAPVTTTVDPGTKYRIWHTTEAFRGARGLALRIGRETREPEESPKSKIEINVVRHDEFAVDAADRHRLILRNGTERFLGFAIKLDPEHYETPRRWILHFQAWQCCAQVQPPLVLQAIPVATRDIDVPIQFIVMKRTDTHLGKEMTSTNGERLHFRDGSDAVSLRRGRWYRFVFRLEPGPQRTAGIALWLDGKLVLDQNGSWGYTPGAEAAIQDSYSVKLGLYRNAQNTSQQIYLDSIRWGLSREDVDPDRY